MNRSHLKTTAWTCLFLAVSGVAILSAHQHKIRHAPVGLSMAPAGKFIEAIDEGEGVTIKTSGREWQARQALNVTSGTELVIERVVRQRGPIKILSQQLCAPVARQCTEICFFLR